MIEPTYAFIIVSVLLILWSLVSTYYCVYFARKLLYVTEQIETSLDILDERYSSIDRILKIPLFYDRDAILEVAASVGRVEETVGDQD